MCQFLVESKKVAPQLSSAHSQRNVKDLTINYVDNVALVRFPDSRWYVG